MFVKGLQEYKQEMRHASSLAYHNNTRFVEFTTNFLNTARRRIDILSKKLYN